MPSLNGQEPTSWNQNVLRPSLIQLLPLPQLHVGHSNGRCSRRRRRRNRHEQTGTSLVWFLSSCVTQLGTGSQVSISIVDKPAFPPSTPTAVSAPYAPSGNKRDRVGTTTAPPLNPATGSRKQERMLGEHERHEEEEIELALNTWYGAYASDEETEGANAACARFRGACFPSTEHLRRKERERRGHTAREDREKDHASIQQ